MNLARVAAIAAVTTSAASGLAATAPTDTLGKARYLAERALSDDPKAFVAAADPGFLAEVGGAGKAARPSCRNSLASGDGAGDERGSDVPRGSWDHL